MIPTEEISPKSGLSRLEEGARYFQEAIFSLQRRSTSDYEHNLKLSAHVGMSALELFIKSYLFQRSVSPKITLTDQDKLKKPNINTLFELMVSYGEPPLDKPFMDRLSRYNRLYNDTKHWDKLPDFPETPLGFAMRDSLNGIADFYLRYFPKADIDPKKLEAIRDYLSTYIGTNVLDAKSIRNLFGDSFRLVQTVNYHPANNEEVQKYYQGAPLNWNIVLVNGDVERDIQNELIATYATPTNQTRVICITGGPGAGKSTLAWRIAYEISNITNSPLLQVLNSKDMRFWSAVELGSLEYVNPIVVLIDDVFSNPDAIRFLENLNPNLNATVISTSQSVEIPSISHLPFVHTVKLGIPSTEEKNKVVNRIIDSSPKSATNLHASVENANSWWAMMMQATKGEALSSIVQKTIRRLAINDSNTYTAFEYICYFGQFDLAVPINILDNLDKNYFNLKNRPASEDIIFQQIDTSSYKTINSVFAREALKAYYAHNPDLIISNTISVINLRDQAHQSFISLWILKKSIAEPTKMKIFFKMHSMFINNLLSHLDILDLGIWLKIYNILDQDKIREVSKKIIDATPETSEGWHMHTQSLRKFGMYEDWVVFYAKIKIWLLANDNASVRSGYNLFVLEKGTAEIAIEAVKDTQVWLSTHPDDSIVRASYLQLMNKYSTEKEKENILRETHHWLKLHPKDIVTRINFLKLVRDHKDKDFVLDVFHETTNWLDMPQNQENINVQFAYMDMVVALNTRRLADNLNNDINKWLAMKVAEHDGGRAKLLSLLHSNKIKLDTKQRIIDGMFEWFLEHSDAPQTKASFLKLSVFMRDDQIISTTSLMNKWLAENPLDNTVRQAYLRFLVEVGTPIDRQSAIDATKKWFESEYSKGNVWETFLKLVGISGTPQQNQQAIDDALNWMNTHSEDKALLIILTSHLEDFGNQDQIDLYLKRTKAWLEAHPGEMHVRSSFLNFVDKYGTREDLDILMADLEKRLNKYLDQTALRAFLWVLSKKTDLPKDLLQRACLLGKRWLDAHPRSSNSLLLGAYGRVLFRLEKYPEALRVLYMAIKSKSEFSPTSHIMLGWCKHYLNKDGALLEFERTRDFANQFPALFSPALAYHQLGKYYFELNDFPEAEKNFRLEVEANPQSAEGYYELGRVFFHRGWPGMALRSIEHADKLSSDELLPEYLLEINNLREKAKSQLADREARKKPNL